MRLLLAACTVACTVACSGPSGQPGDALTQDGFWSLVGSTASAGSVPDRAAVLTEALRGRSTGALEGYQSWFVRVTTELDRRALQDVAGVVCPGLDDEGFADVRAWLVAQGRSTVERVEADPVALASVPGIRAACDRSGESFGDVAIALYSDRGFEPGSAAFPLPVVGGATGARASADQLRRAGAALRP